MYYIWKYFIDLQNKRGSSGFGVNPISWTDMLSYFSLIQYQPYEYEIELINRLDSIALKAYAEQQERESKKKKS
jgi:hypothetical protein